MELAFVLGTDFVCTIDSNLGWPRSPETNACVSEPADCSVVFDESNEEHKDFHSSFPRRILLRSGHINIEINMRSKVNRVNLYAQNLSPCRTRNRL